MLHDDNFNQRVLTSVQVAVVVRCLAFVLLVLSVPSVVAQEEREEFEQVLEEVVVMAQKRSQSLQEVPLAVTAFSGKVIEDSGYLTLVGISELQPSVTFDVAQNYQNASLKIRGIGTVGNARNFEGSVGIFIDGVYRSRSAMVLSDIYDIERVEILRGPQSTLFGKNTVAGAIALFSNRPDPSGTFGNAELRYGNYDGIFLAGVLNTPIGDSGAFRLSGNFSKRDAFFTSPDNGDGYDAVDRYGLKTQFLFNPTDDLEILLIADYGKSDARCCWGSPIVVNGPTTPVVQTYSALNGLTFVLAPDAEHDRSNSLNTHPREKIIDYGLNFQITKDFSQGSLSSVTALRKWKNTQYDADPDWTGADFFQFGEPADITFFSQEFNYNTEVKNTDLLLGFYYSHEKFNSVRDVRSGSDADNYLNFVMSSGVGATACLPPVVALDCLFPVGIGALAPVGSFSVESFEEKATSWAVFAHAVTPLTDKWDLILGLRYSEDHKKGGFDALYWYDSAIVRAVLAGMGVEDDGTPRNGFDLIGAPYSPSFQDKTKDDEVTGTITLQYNLNDDVMFYGGYHRGYKASGINLFREAVITDTTTYAPETADSFELGLKMKYWSGRALTNIALFNTQFSDMQINFFEDLTFRTENTAESSTKGVEVENVFQFTDDLQMYLAMTFMDAKFDQIDTESLKYLEGRDTPRAPGFSGVLSLTWDRPITDRLNLFARGMASYMGDHFISPDIPNEQKADGYTLFDASIGLRSPGSNWELLAWCSNCGDETYRTMLINTPFQPGTINAYLGPARQYGLTLRMWF